MMMGDKKMEGGKMMGKGCGPMHWRCCVWPMLSRLIWLAALVSLVFAWMAKTDTYMGWGAQWWFWNALVLAVLAVPGSGKHMGACRHGMDCKCETCSVK